MYITDYVRMFICSLIVSFVIYVFSSSLLLFFFSLIAFFFLFSYLKKKMRSHDTKVDINNIRKALDDSEKK